MVKLSEFVAVRLCSKQRMHMVNSKNLSEIQEYIDNSVIDELRRLKISILRNIMIEPIEPYLQYLGLKMGFAPEVIWGNFDNVMQDAINRSEDVIAADCDCVMIFTKLDTLSPKLAYEFTGLSKDEIDNEVEIIRNYVHDTLAGIREKTNAIISWYSFEVPCYPAFGVIDSSGSTRQVLTISRLNTVLANQLHGCNNGVLIDSNLCLARIGVDNYYDNRYWHIGKAPYSLAARSEIAPENFKLIRAIKGKNKKCLVLDCDNTLWGGIVGEDGCNGIRLGPDYPGSQFYEFQKEILSLHKRGIILALCSKNNKNDIDEVLEKHPHMILRKHHISTSQINWNDKATNILQIAEDLNIGLDSVVFVDDSEFEIDLVKQSVPNIETILLPEDQSYNYRTLLASSGLFDTLSVTDEDINRGELYKANAKRRKAGRQFSGSLEEYYKTVEMQIVVEKASPDSFGRIAQLTQRTNQFNLTTTRYSDSDIQDFSNDIAYDVILLRLSDRFGDTGIVGCAILRHSDLETYIDTFLLSCRVIGRGVEAVLLNTCISISRKRNLGQITGKYVKTARNSQVSEFYENNNFARISGSSNEASFRLTSDMPINKIPNYFKRIEVNV